MRNTPYDGYLGPRLPREVQLRRIKNVMQQELTPLQQEVITANYIRRLTVTQIAQERGVNKSTVSRMLRRAENRLRRFLKY